MRVTVVGAGIVGLAVAYELLGDGHEVTVLDTGTPGRGAAAGSAAKIALAETGPVPAPGMVSQGLRWMLDPGSPLYVRPSLSPPFLRFMLAMARHCTAAAHRRGLELNLELATRSLAVFDEWAAAGLAFEEHRRGVLLVFEHRRSFDARRRHEDAFARAGNAGEPLDAAALQALEPALGDSARHGLRYAADRQVEPLSLADALLGALRAGGATVLADRAATGFERRGGRVAAVRTGAGPIAADHVVVAAGAHTGRVAGWLGARLPVRPGKGYSLHYEDPPTALRHPLTFEDAHVAVAPLDGGLRIAGTMEFGGFDLDVTPRRVAAIADTAARAFRDWDPAKPPRPAWAGLRPMTPDGLPAIGPLTDGVTVATGHAMLGLTQAPGTGRLVRDLLRGTPAPPALAGLGPERFTR